VFAQVNGRPLNPDHVSHGIRRIRKLMGMIAQDVYCVIELRRII
jgi:hypothetical protein